MNFLLLEILHHGRRLLRVDAALLAVADAEAVDVVEHVAVDRGDGALGRDGLDHARLAVEAVRDGAEVAVPEGALDERKGFSVVERNGEE